METYAHMVNVREPRVNNIIGFVDGVAIPVQCSDDVFEQSAHYNGYYHDTTVNNVFAFAPNGKIIFAAINYPGSWHDSTVVHGLVDLVLKHIGTYAMCVDQGFPRSGALHDKFVGPLSKKARRRLAPEVREYILELIAIYISLRQSSEWGMRALQGSFSRLKSRLTSDKKKSWNILMCICLLHNLRTHYVGLNQIAIVFNPEYEQYIQVDTYDRIASVGESSV
jgi:hypothetical protein